MRIGSRVQLVGGTIAEFLGLAGVESAHIKVNGKRQCVPRSHIKGKPRTSHKWPVGQAVTVELDGTTVRGEVIQSRPLVARVNDGHKVYHGAEVNKDDGKIRRME